MSDEDRRRRLAAWEKVEYSHAYPHSSIDGLMPAEFEQPHDLKAAA